MRQIFKIFFKAEGTNPFLVLFCLFFGGLAEAIGIGSLLPVTSAILDPGEGKPSLFEYYVRQVFELLSVSPSFTNLILLIIGIMVLRSALLFGAMSYAGITSARVANSFRARIIKSVIEARWSFYANQSAGRLATTLGNDISMAGQAYQTFATVVTFGMQIITYAIIAALINWKVAVAGMLGGILIALASSKLVKISRNAGYKQSDRIGIITSDTVEMLQNIKALKTMSRYESLLVHLDHVLARLKKSLYASILSRYGLTYGNDLLVTLLVGLGAYISHVKAGISVPEMFVFGVLFFQVVSYASKMQKQVQLAAQYEGAYVRVTEVLEEAVSSREINTGIKTPNIGKAIAINDVSFSHAEKPVLNHLSLDIPANAITVVQGPSGAGKTTLLDLLVGSVAPATG